MSRVEVLGRDAAAEAYRIRAHLDDGPCEALVPECLMDTLRPGERPSHEDAYAWIAARRTRIAAAIDARARGIRPRAPWDLIALTGGETGNGR